MVQFLKRTLQNEGIAVDHLIEDDKYFTTLVFVEIDENGERQIFICKKTGRGYTTSERRTGSDAFAKKGKTFSFRIAFPDG